MTSETQNTVSVIIAAYNAAKTIKRAIRSIQDDSTISQIIVVDDASTDNTVQIVETLCKKDPRILCLQQKLNQGPSAARNIALNNATGQWISILDADDYIIGNRATNLLNLVQDEDMIADDMFQISNDRAELDRPTETLLRPPLTTEIKIPLTDFVQSNITKGKRTRGELGFIKPLIKTSKLKEHNIIYQEHMRLGEDYELYVRLLANGAKLKIVPAQGYVSVRRETSLSGQHSINDLKSLRDCNEKLLNDFENKLTKLEQKALRKHYLSIDGRYQWRCLIDAVKEKNIKAAIKTFLRPYPVPFYVLGKLFEQLILRSKKSLCSK